MNERQRAAARRILGWGLPAPRILRPLLRAGHGAGVWILEAGNFLRKLVWTEPLLRALADSVGAGLRADRLPYIRGRGSLIIGENVTLSGRSCFYFMRVDGPAPKIRLGDRVFVGHGCTFSAACSITVGNDALISAGVRIHDNDGHPLDPERRLRGERIRRDEAAEVEIGDGAWIGAQAIVLKGARIGKNAIVGAGAVVTSEVPAGAVAAGNPARVVKQGHDLQV